MNLIVLILVFVYCFYEITKHKTKEVVFVSALFLVLSICYVIYALATKTFF